MRTWDQHYSRLPEGIFYIYRARTYAGCVATVSVVVIGFIAGNKADHSDMP